MVEGVRHATAMVDQVDAVISFSGWGLPASVAALAEGKWVPPPQRLSFYDQAMESYNLQAGGALGARTDARLSVSVYGAWSKPPSCKHNPPVTVCIYLLRPSLVAVRGPGRRPVACRADGPAHGRGAGEGRAAAPHGSR